MPSLAALPWEGKWPWPVPLIIKCVFKHLNLPTPLNDHTSQKRLNCARLPKPAKGLPFDAAACLMHSLKSAIQARIRLLLRGIVNGVGGLERQERK